MEAEALQQWDQEDQQPLDLEKEEFQKNECQ
jgi:hypothetical protein